MPSMFETTEKELAILAQKAKSTGCWFYCSRSDDWLTPEDFESLGKSYLIMYGQSCRTVILEYNIADPKIGLARRMRKLNEATADLEKFTERVTTYFNFIAKKDNE